MTGDGDAPQRPGRAGVPGHHRPGVDPARLHRIRGAAHPHRPAPADVRGRTAVDRAPPTSRTGSPPPTSCPARPRPSWPSSAPGGCGGRPGPSSAGSASSSPAWCSSWPSPRCSWPATRPPGCSAPPPGPGRRCPPWPSTPPRAWSRPVAGASGPSTSREAPLVGLRPGGRGLRRHRRALPRPRPRLLRRDRDRHPPASLGRRVPAPCGPSPPGRGPRGRRRWPPRLAWVALKVGALSYGGGFVIIPLMQHDAVTTYHWMTGGPVPQRRGPGPDHPGPGGPDRGRRRLRRRRCRWRAAGRLHRLRPVVRLRPGRRTTVRPVSGQRRVQSFLTGAGPAVVGAIAGSAIPLGLSFQHLWQIPVLAGAGLWMFALRRGVVETLLIAGLVGVGLALLGVPA